MGSLPVGNETIPTIDISPFLAENASEQAVNEVVDSVRHACTTYGFFQLVGHGVSDEERDGILECAKRFFELPVEEKMEVQIKHSMGKSFRGYEPPGIQTHQKGLKADTKEAFIVGAEIPKDDPEAGTFSTGPNLWPKSLPSEIFRTPIMNYQATMLALVKTLLKILARGLPGDWGCSPDVLDEFAENPSMPMRLLHYAPQPVRDESQFGVGDHTDFGGITVLLQQEGTAGLEVWYPPTETWIPVPVQHGGYVINMGDMMQKWTAGYYRSARHRVISSVGDKHRYSVPFFLNGKLKLNCKTLDGSGEETVVGEHIRQRLIETMGESGKMLK
ncbi:2-oxoglutarate-dependent dioxygenase asL3 [Lobaria immixta]|nr:2-oxoglutarate-dependent dioxygenase asL3 [Lobaria immixta]